MAAFIGKKFNTFNANSFVSAFMSDSIYLYVGKETTAAAGASQTSNDVVQDHNKIWDNMAGAVRVTRDKVAIGIDRVDWTSGVVYEKYNHANTIMGTGTGFYVLAGLSDRDVFKCLDNNGDSSSTIKPTKIQYGVSKEDDGYVWKYMYTIPDASFTQFATANVLPVYPNFNTRGFARPGSIIQLPISANSITGIGKDYRGTGFSNGTYGISAVAATNFHTIHANTATNEIKIVATSGLAEHEDYYANSVFFMTSGNAKGTWRVITKSTIPVGEDGVSSNLTFASAITNFANGDMFIIGPRVMIQDINGTGYLGMGEVNSYGNVTSILTNESGGGYANGDCTVLVNGDYKLTTGAFPVGSLATVELPVPPSGGHGYNVFTELGAKYVIISPDTTIPQDHETGTFIGYKNAINQIGLVKNPIDSYSGRIAARQSYDMRTTLYFAHPTSIQFLEDQVVNNMVSGTESARGIVFSVCGNATEEYVSLINVQGGFANGDVIYNTTGASSRINDVNLGSYQYPMGSSNIPQNSVVPGGLTKYMGEILYHENINPINRSLGQKENFKFVFEL